MFIRLVLIYFCLFAIINGQDSFNIQVIKPTNVTIGSLPDANETITVDEILKNFLKINTTTMNASEIIKFSQIEDESKYGKEMIKMEMHPYIQAIHLAYSNHLPLILTPDMIWYLIASGASIHIRKNAERLRSKFVNHEGKKEIVVRRDYFVFNGINPWNEVIEEFSEKIELNSKLDTNKLFKSNFSTTSQESQVVSQIVLMDAMEKYFSFTFVTLCGIPEIRILGVKDDWIKIKSKIRALNDLIDDLDVWFKSLHEVLDKFIDVYDGKIDNTFWSQIYKVQGGSGGPYISGWSIVLFPYLNNEIKNYFVWEKNWQDAYNSKELGGLTTRHFAMNLNQVPFKWHLLNKEYDMLFVGGLFGIRYNETDKSLRPVFGYSVIVDINKINNLV